MHNRLMIAALLVVVPLAWSMASENTALVKTFAAGVFAAGLLFANPGIFAPFRSATPVHALAILGIISAAFSQSPSFSWPVVLSGATFWIIAAASAGSTTPAFWLRTITGASLLPVAAGLVQASGLDPTGWKSVVQEHFHGRICSTLANPNFYAAYLVATIPFILSFAATARGAPLRFAALALAAAAGAALIFTGSKGGILGIIAAAAITALLLRRSRIASPRLLGRFAVGGALLLLLALAAMPAGIRGRVLMLSPGFPEKGASSAIIRDESVRFRYLTWTQTMRMIRDAPIAGHGIGRFQVVYPRYRLPEIIRMFGQHSYMTDHPENISLEFAAELGIVGAGIWLWLLVFMARLLSRPPVAGSSECVWMRAACAGSLGGLLVTNSFGVDIHYGATAVLAACLTGAAVSAGPARPARTPRWLAVAGALALGMAWARIYASDAALERALNASTARRWETAIPGYRRALLMNPANVMARYFGASALLDRNREADLPEAERLLNGVRREAPDYVLLNHKYWLLYNRLRMAEKADEALARQIELDPLLGASIHLERGRQAVGKERWDEAYAEFETAIRLDPEGTAGYQYLGNLMVLKNRFSEALSVYGQGLERDPDSVHLNYNAAVAALRLGNRDLARLHAEAVLRSDPSHAQAGTILSRVGP